MTPLHLLQVFLSESSAIAGQILFKHAMGDSKRNSPFWPSLAMGIGCMAFSYFVWQALLQKFQLSYLFPFDGLNRVLLVASASIFLKEKATPRLWAGVILISSGVLLVSGS